MNVELLDVQLSNNISSLLQGYPGNAYTHPVEGLEVSLRLGMKWVMGKKYVLSIKIHTIISLPIQCQYLAAGSALNNPYPIHNGQLKPLNMQVA